MDSWLRDALALCPPDLGWEARRRWLILGRWPSAAVRAAEQDARQGRPEALALYDAEVAAIKAAVPKP
ncbi:MAG: hypothetical protein ACM31D_05795 [Bacteroidota bacterium]